MLFAGNASPARVRSSAPATDRLVAQQVVGEHDREHRLAADPGAGVL